MADVLQIFVVGCPRSGTTLVQSLLATHPALTGFTESHVFDKAFNWRGRADPAELHRRVASFVQENALAGDAHDAAGFIALLDAAATRRGCAGWIEKTPDHVFRIPLIRSHAPDARFIHVVRRAEGVLPSLHKASQTPGWRNVKPWWECAAHWLAALRISDRHAGEPNHAIVGYEQLVTDPEAQMRRLIGWLGLPWDETVLRDHAAEAESLISAGETWKTNAMGSIADRTAWRPSDLPWIARQAARWARRYRKLESYLDDPAELGSSRPGP